MRFIVEIESSELPPSARDQLLGKGALLDVESVRIPVWHDEQGRDTSTGLYRETGMALRIVEVIPC